MTSVVIKRWRLPSFIQMGLQALLPAVYGHLPGYLHRWRIFGFGRFMVRIHHILDIDRTPFLHTHPFAFVSIVLVGSYTEHLEQKDGTLKVVHRKRGSIVFRSARAFHRIDALQGKRCCTLFLTWKVAGNNQNWTLKRHPQVATPAEYGDAPDGIYALEDGFRKRSNGIWYAKRKTKEEAMACERLSIHQQK